jgi:hypothetical protein
MSPLKTACAALLLLASSAGAVDLTPEQERLIGRRIWLNEGGGKAQFLTHWNDNEAFASMGIGHFIWYPSGAGGDFVESFPPLTQFLRENGRALPAWTNGPCPWNTKEAFFADFDKPRLAQLRARLAEPELVSLQTRFIIRRLERSLAAMLAAAPEEERAAIEARFRRVLADPVGAYALIDYVNFKGEGTAAGERYPDESGKGWGMLQALELMDDAATGRAHAAFADGALRSLRRRVELCPLPGSPAYERRRRENRRLPDCAKEREWLGDAQPPRGWAKRIDTYRASTLEELVPETR